MADEREQREYQDHHDCECDRRLLVLEGWRAVIDGEVNSLRSSRHEYGNWLNRHNLEINQMQYQNVNFSEGLKSNTDATKQLSLQVAALDKALANATMKVGVIIGVLVFLANLAVKYIKL